MTAMGTPDRGLTTLLEAIRVGVLPEATAEARRQGALACRTILTQLEHGSDALDATGSALGALIAQLRRLLAEQIVDLAFTRLRSARPLRFVMVRPPHGHDKNVHEAELPATD